MNTKDLRNLRSNLCIVCDHSLFYAKVVGDDPAVECEDCGAIND